ncbi:MAG: hypothetical protein AB7F74_13360 [Parvibaculaceae bacterium]
MQRSDFHVGADDDPDDREPKDLFIDVLISLPELADETATAETVAPSFRHMQLERDGKSPVFRFATKPRPWARSRCKSCSQRKRRRC